LLFRWYIIGVRAVLVMLEQKYTEDQLVLHCFIITITRPLSV